MNTQKGDGKLCFNPYFDILPEGDRVIMTYATNALTSKGIRWYSFLLEATPGPLNVDRSNR